MSFIYVASPYSDKDADVVEERFLAVEKYTAAMLKEEQYLYSPIVHCHSIADKYELPLDFNFWKNYNQAMLSKASLLVVLMLDGWEESKGVTAEIEFAKSCGIEVEYV